MSPNRTIDIHEVEATSSTSNNERTCFVKVVIDGICIYESLEIRDLFEEDDKKLYDWYLEKYPLPLPEAATPDEEAQSPSQRRPSFGIHQILWESLEQPQLWISTSILSSRIDVAVRRIVLAPPSSGVPWESRPVTRESPLRVLLVIARDLVKTAKNKYEDLIPHIAQIHLLSVQDDLFDLVHFDLHGDTNGDPKNAYPRFASSRIDETGLDDRRAEEVADLLARTGVRCVATNACRTAVSYDRREANMCQIFIDKGISHVSGMSHNICIDAIDLFYSGFYRALITKGFKFAEAASQGRRRLRLEKRRNYVASKQLVDWCVPVTYMCPDGQVCGQDYTPFAIPSTLQMFRSLSLYFRNLYRRLKLQKLASMIPGISSTTRSRLRATKSSNALCSSSFSPRNIYGTRDDSSLVPKATLPKLDINILDFEKHLIHHGTVYFHGPDHDQNVETMLRLGLLWCRTNFVERVIYVRARQYLEEHPKHYIIQWDRNTPFKKVSPQPINFDFLELSSPHKKLAIVIQGIHELYPDDEERTAAERDRVVLARQRLENFLMVDVASRVEEKNMYVVITGKKDAGWWENSAEVGLWGQPFWRGDPIMEHMRNDTF
ncbi:hypothetical protein F5Y08DRAFT_354995 [Xylaria arbuscula]|nr:hypothetical protein F5Y08DRAFT_354995 [Xylaria arbuscula]